MCRAPAQAAPRRVICQDHPPHLFPYLNCDPRANLCSSRPQDAASTNAPNLLGPTRTAAARCQSSLPETPDLKVAPESRVFAPRCAPMPCSRQGSSLPEKDEGLPGRPGSPRKLCRIWSGKPGSNRRPSAWEADQSAGKARKAQQNDISRLVQSRKIPSGWARPCPNLAQSSGSPTEDPCRSDPRSRGVLPAS